MATISEKAAHDLAVQYAQFREEYDRMGYAHQHTSVQLSNAAMAAAEELVMQKYHLPAVEREGDPDVDVLDELLPEDKS